MNRVNDLNSLAENPSFVIVLERFLILARAIVSASSNQRKPNDFHSHAKY